MKGQLWLFLEGNDEILLFNHLKWIGVAVESREGQWHPSPGAAPVLLWGGRCKGIFRVDQSRSVLGVVTAEKMQFWDIFTAILGHFHCHQ